MEEAGKRFIALVTKQAPMKKQHFRFEHEGREVSFYDATDAHAKYCTLELRNEGLYIELKCGAQGWPKDGNPQFVNTIMDTAEYIVRKEWPTEAIEEVKELGVFREGDIVDVVGHPDMSGMTGCIVRPSGTGSTLVHFDGWINGHSGNNGQTGKHCKNSCWFISAKYLEHADG